MSWMTFIGAAIALHGWEHIGIDFFVTKLSPKMRDAVNLFARFSVLFFVVFLFVTGINLVTSSSKMISDALRISLVWPRLSVPVGAGFMMIHVLNLIYQDIEKIRNKKGDL